MAEDTRSPLLSVVVPCRNRSGFLRETLESILTQDYPNIECIVMDGGSNDGTVEILESYGRRIRWRSEPDSGPADAINKGWALASGEVVTWLNADDRWRPGAATAAMNYLRVHPAIDVVYGSCRFIDRSGREVWRLKSRPWSFRRSLLYCDHIIDQPASFLRRAIVDRVGALRDRSLHDQDYWLRIGLAGGCFAAIPEVLADGRIYNGNMGSAPEIIVPMKVEVIDRIYRENHLPDFYLRRRRQAMSNARVRGFDSLQPAKLKHWWYGFKLLGGALRQDPLNAPYIFGHLAFLFGRHARRGFRDPRTS
ncbi:MAG: glycosyltransferase family 2 protein [Anaerolineaceae bacterium]